MFSNTLVLRVTVLLAAVILFFSTSSAIKGGKAGAQAAVVFHNTQETIKALQFFNSDQNRYPSAVEFTDRNIMLQYISDFPVREFVTANCPASFLYERPTLHTYRLNFCLPSSQNGFKSGWNSVGK